MEQDDTELHRRGSVQQPPSESPTRRRPKMHRPPLAPAQPAPMGFSPTSPIPTPGFAAFAPPPMVLPMPTPLTTPTTESMKDTPQWAQISNPLRQVVDALLSEPASTSTLVRLEKKLRWDAVYEPTVGPLRNIIMMYSSLFLISPVSDAVIFRESAHLLQERRTGATTKPVTATKRYLETHSQAIGHVSSCCVARAFDLRGFEGLYRRRGLTVNMVDDVLHVSYLNDFDLFVFDTGTVVWWGKDRIDHWIVNDDFMTDNFHTRAFITDRHPQRSIAKLFPVWWTYSIDGTTTAHVAGDSGLSYWSRTDSADADPAAQRRETEARTGAVDYFDEQRRHQPDAPPTATTLGGQYTALEAAVSDARIKGFVDSLVFDHFLIPPKQPFVKIAISCALAQSAVADLLEHNVNAASQHTMAAPSVMRRHRRLLNVHRGEVYKLMGELFINRSDLFDPSEQPKFLWEHTPFLPYFRLTQNQCSIALRMEWLQARIKTLRETLATAATNKHRREMIRWDWFLISLLVVDSCVLLSRLFLRHFFPFEDA
jgi:uncharacterized Rmd1/YagE family protein